MSRSEEGAMVIVTWNVHGRVGQDVAAQAAVIVERKPQIVALQEVREAEAPRYAHLLAQGQDGLLYSCTTTDRLSRSGEGAQGGRKVLLIASCWPLTPQPELTYSLDHLDPSRLDPRLRETVRQSDPCLPGRDTTLSASIQAPGGAVQVINAYIPHGVLYNKRKAATPEEARREDEKAAKARCERVKKLVALSSIAHHLAGSDGGSCILCGDLNTTLEERSYRVQTGVAGIAGRELVADDWMRPERVIVQSLLRRGFRDGCGEYREEPGWPSFSWVSKQRGWEYRKRLDHVIAGPALRLLTCAIRHEPRAAGLSDHSLVEVDFAC